MGLMGIDIFDRYGHMVTINNVYEQVDANPPDINILPDYDNDPRTIDKLFDGINHTRDPLHAWLIPYTAGNDHTIKIDFQTNITISMIRIWNYNSGRTHASRGVRYIEITLDNKYIFKGDIKKAPGLALDIDSCNECILFTIDDNILKLIERYDYITKQINTIENQSVLSAFSRPKTAKSDSKDLKYVKMGSDGRPKTGLIDQDEEKDNRHINQKFRPKTANTIKNNPVINGRFITIELYGNYGDINEIGLTSIKVLNKNCEPMKLRGNEIIFENEKHDNSDCRVLLNNEDITTDNNNMWSYKFEPDKYHPYTYKFKIDLKSICQIKGLLIYNYNYNEEESYKGVRNIRVFIDNELATYTVYLII